MFPQSLKNPTESIHYSFRFAVEFLKTYKPFHAKDSTGYSEEPVKKKIKRNKVRHRQTDLLKQRTVMFETTRFLAGARYSSMGLELMSVV